MSQFKEINQAQQALNNSLVNKNERQATIARDIVSMSTFDKSFQQATTFDSGKLIPICMQICNPKDIYEIDINSLIRLSAQASTPFMNINYDVNFFFIPLEQLDKDFKEVFGESPTYGYNKTPLNLPMMEFDTPLIYNENDLANYFNIPIHKEYKDNFKINILPFLAYSKVWNEWYRDENYQDSINTSTWNNELRTLKSSGYNEKMSFYESLIYGKGLAPTSKLPSYFTTLLPYQQKGQPIQIASTNLNDLIIKSYNKDDENYRVGHSTPLYSDSVINNQIKYQGLAINRDTNYIENLNVELVSQGSYGAKQANFNLQIENKNPNALPYTISDLRNSIVLQHLMENWGLCGSRYVEQLKSIWGIEINPLQINRCELVGGFNDTLQFSNVVQTSSTINDSQLGNIASNLYNTLSLPKIEYASSQHGILLGLLTCRTNINNGGQGLPKFFIYNDMYDFHNPIFNGISEQPMKSIELYYNDKETSKNDDVLGFNEPFIETKYNIDNANGFFSLNSKTSLFSYFLFGEKYNDTPIINDEWMRYDSNIIGNTLWETSDKTKEFYHQFISIFTFDIKYTTSQPLFNSPSVSKI